MVADRTVQQSRELLQRQLFKDSQLVLPPQLGHLEVAKHRLGRVLALPRVRAYRVVEGVQVVPESPHN